VRRPPTHRARAETAISDPRGRRQWRAPHALRGRWSRLTEARVCCIRGRSLVWIATAASVFGVLPLVSDYSNAMLRRRNGRIPSERSPAWV